MSRNDGSDVEEEFPAQDCESPECPDRPHKVGPWTR